MATTDGFDWAIEPNMKKVAGMFWLFSAFTTCRVVLLFGPSSKVSATQATWLQSTRPPGWGPVTGTTGAVVAGLAAVVALAAALVVTFEAAVVAGALLAGLGGGVS